MTRTESKDPLLARRLLMVERQIRRRGVRDERVLAAIERVPRHHFVPLEDREYAYDDNPLPIGSGQTISQPYIVALMTEALRLTPQSVVLEVGTGSGYQTAVLAELAREVYSIERLETLGKEARDRLDVLGYENVTVRIGDGHRGWPEAAPFDAIIVTAAPERVPEALVEQLVDGGRLVIPVGSSFQELRLVIKRGTRVENVKITDVRFVPMVGGDAD